MALWRIRATVDDRPGFLSVLTASLALRAVNILAVQVHTTEAGAVDDFLVDAPDALTEAELVAAVEKGRGRDAWVARAQAHGLVDPPTRALAVAARVVRDPDSLGEGLRQLLGGDFRPASDTAVVWRAADERPRYGFGGGVMRLPDPHGGTYEVTRAAPDFTPAEYARAQALVDLAGAAVRQPAAEAVLLLADGTEVTLRAVAPEDLPAVAALRGRRAGGSGAGGPARGCTALLAEAGDRVVGVATPVGEGRGATVEVLVEDGWRGRGLDTALLRRLRARAGAREAAVDDAAVDDAAANNGGVAANDGGAVASPRDNREVPTAGTAEPMTSAPFGSRRGRHGT